MAIQFLRGRRIKVEASNKVLADGQPLYEKDTHKLKIGDGSTAAKSLPYIKVDTDSALSSRSTNPIQNQAVNTALLSKADYLHYHKASEITSGVIPLDRGGTGATKADDARNNLGAFSKSGGTLTGNVTISKDSNPFFKLQIGNNTATGIVQVYIPNGSSTQKMAVGFGSEKSIIVDDDGCLILTGAMYGTTLPAAGKKGRIFFKKVN